MWFKYSYPGPPELVFVSHVIHPCHFYIRRYSQRKNATVLEKKVNQFCSESVHLHPSDILELGNEILLQVKISSVYKYCNLSVYKYCWSAHTNFL